MSSKNDNYRNPPVPLGYVIKKPPDLIKKESNNVADIDVDRLIEMIIGSGICDEPDVSIYEHFTINSSSDEEEIIEVPVVVLPKHVEVVDIIEDDVIPELKEDIHVTIKKEVDSPKHQTTAEKSKDLVQASKDSVSLGHKKDSVKPEEDCHINENFDEDKNVKRYDKDINRISRNKEIKKRRDAYDSCGSDSSRHRKRSRYQKKLYENDGESRSRSLYKRQDIVDSDSDSHRSRNKRRDSFNSDDDFQSRSQRRKRSNCDSDSDSYSKSRRRKGNSYGSDSDSYSKSRHRKRNSYGSDSDSHSKSRHRKRNSSGSDSDTHSRSRHRKRNSYDSDSDSHSRSRHRKRSSYYSDGASSSQHKKRENSDSDNNSHSRRRHNERNDHDRRSSSEKRKPKRYDSKTDKNDSATVIIVKRQRSPSPHSSTRYGHQEYEEPNIIIKQEIQPGMLYGEYKCEICKVVMNNQTTYQSHIKGKRHKKMLAKIAQTNGDQKVAEWITKASTEKETKYPKPPIGYSRVAMDTTAKIQPDIDRNTKMPFPGLDRVTEIHGVAELTYYCSFCDSHCSYNCILQHLNGFKHQMKCVKHYRQDLYEKWSYKQKFQISDAVIDVLKTEERRNGRGFIKVEKDVKESDHAEGPEFVVDINRNYNMPSTSAQSLENNYLDKYITNSRPDPRKSGYYCKICDSHSNSESMWNSHITGKRHVANLNKLPGTAPSKTKYLPATSDVRPHLFDILERENPYHYPVVGLDQIREIRKPDINSISYNCFLCGAFISSFDIVDHILSTKHREKYLESIKHSDLETAKGLPISEQSRVGIISNICTEVEFERGTGTPEVYYAKSSVLKG